MRRVFVLACALLFASGCATRLSYENPIITVVWGDAYTLDCENGQTAVVDGEVVCTSGDSVEVRGGHIGESMVGIVKAVLEVIGGLLPRGVTP